jgi:protein O-mannosyl-transferase
MAKNNKKNIPPTDQSPLNIPQQSAENKPQATENKPQATEKTKANGLNNDNLNRSANFSFDKDVIEISKAASFVFLTKYWLNALIVFLLSCIIYSNTISHNYAVDDAIVITRNQFTRLGLNGMPGIWTEDTFVGFFGKQQQLVSGGRYRPFSVATFALEMAIFGDHPKDGQGNYIKDAKGDFIKNADGKFLYDCSPAISHSINIVLYGLLCVLIYFCVLQLFNSRIAQTDEEGKNLPDEQIKNEFIKAGFIALAAALLYATHPIHTEAIANIKGRDEILVMLGSVMALHYTVKAAISNHNPANFIFNIFLACFGFLIGIFSKESAIPFLAVIPAALYIFVPKISLGKIASLTAPLLVLTIIFWFGIRKPILYFDPSTDPMAKILDSLSADMYKGNKSMFFWIGNEPTEIMNNPFLKLENGRYVIYNDNERMATILYTWAYYLKLLAIPHPLTNDYYPRHIPVQEKDATRIHNIPKMDDTIPSFSLMLHAFLGFYGLWAVFKRKPIGFCLLFYFATFSVVSNFFFPIGTNMAERFMFMPSLAFSLAAAIGLAALVNKEKQDYTISLSILGFVCALYSFKTFDRNFAWKDDYTLFTTDIEVSKNSAKLNNAVSGVLQDSLNREPDPNKREKIARKALVHSTKAIQMHPTYNNAWLLYGNANAMLANMSAAKTDSFAYKDALKFYAEAVKSYIEVRRLRPDHPDVPQNLASTYRDYGRLQAEKFNNMVNAAQLFSESTKWQPNDPETWRLLGIAQGMLAQPKLAIEAFQKALKLNPNVASVWYNLSVAYAQIGDTANATEAMNKSRALEPNNPTGGQAAGGNK